MRYFGQDVTRYSGSYSKK